MNAIKIDKRDNVAVAAVPLKKGETVVIDGVGIVLADDIPAGHKFAVEPIEISEPIIKYGCRIGFARNAVKRGGWVHTHNLETALSGIENYTYTPIKQSAEESSEPLFFNGYVRENGSVGTRNEIWIIPTVGCVNGIAKELEKKARDLVGGSIDGVAAFTHPYGCSQLGGDQENTRRILADLIKHPNAGAVLVVGLGCENSGIGVIKGYIGDYSDERVKFLNCQDSEDEISDGAKLLEQLAEYASRFSRERVSAAELTVGLKCGGSDGFSGITANPLVGRFSDILVRGGGTAILTEVPEMFGAEALLMNRCADEKVFDGAVKMINGFKEYYRSAGQPIYENPSPGNKAGGISTLEDKSLGCTQKSGTSTVQDVLEYGDRVNNRGLNLLAAPGNDLVASTALAAAGAQLILFTTGRGTPFASPVPTIKISSNTPLSEKKGNWIDFNAGAAIEGISPDDMARLLTDFVLETASGRRVRSEEAGYHDMAIFKKGVTL